MTNLLSFLPGFANKISGTQTSMFCKIPIHRTSIMCPLMRQSQECEFKLGASDFEHVIRLIMSGNRLNMPYGILSVIAMEYKQSGVLVETDWVNDHLNDKLIRIAEVDYDPTANYNLGHIPGAVLLDWKTAMNDPVKRDILSQTQLDEVLSKAGVTPSMKLVLYGDFNNWFAAFVFWILNYYGVENVVLMNGGRKKWIAEDKAISKDVPSYQRTSFKSRSPNENVRTYLDYVKQSLKQPKKILVDVRSPAEFTGTITAPPEYPNEHAQRGGHIPGAINIPWSQAVKEDGTFKAAEDLAKLYQSQGVTADKEVITYCRIGERSSFTWFVLKYLLGYPNVKNYDGSWTEWGNMIRNPIEKP